MTDDAVGQLLTDMWMPIFVGWAIVYGVALIWSLFTDVA